MQRQLALFASIIGIASIAQAQGCFPQGITFNLQDEVDAFPTNYPGCTQILGRLQIGFSNEAAADGIYDLSPLSEITAVGGDMIIEYTYGIESLAGLNNLTSVGGDLRIRNTYNLSDISALANLISVGDDLEVSANTHLSSLNGLGSVASTGGKLRISEPGLTDLQGLEGLLDIGGALTLEDNSDLVSMNGLAPSSVGAAFWIKNNALLTDLSSATGLTSIGAALNLQNNPSLSSLEELAGITSLGGFLRVQNMPLLTDLSPLAGIDPESITQLVLQDLPGISDCALESICGFLARPTPDATIGNNAVGCASVTEVEAACGTTSISDMAVFAGRSIHIFPNPSSGLFQLQADMQGRIELKVYDVAGRTVHSEISTASSGWTQSLALEHLLPGGYLLRLHSDDGIATARLTIE